MRMEIEVKRAFAPDEVGREEGCGICAVRFTAETVSAHVLVVGAMASGRSSASGFSGTWPPPPKDRGEVRNKMHVKGHVREAFGDFAEAGFLLREDLTLDTPVNLEKNYRPCEVPLSELLGSLWNCTDIMPSDLRTMVRDGLRMEEAYTYAQAAQRLHRVLSMPSV